MAIISFLGSIVTVAISSAVSFFVARHQAKNEIKKILMSYDREDKKLFNDAFANLMTKSSEFCSYPCISAMQDAIEANSNFLAIAPVSYHQALKEMDTAIKNSKLSQIHLLREKLLDIYTNNK